ncbi:MAG: D-glucuronyl C5-epimerase family protein [Sulfolobales archaeon]
MIIEVDLVRDSVSPNNEYSMGGVAKLFTRERFFEKGLAKIRVIETDSLRRFYILIPSSIENIWIMLVDDQGSMFRKIADDREYEIYSTNRNIIFISKKIICYGENFIGPYIVSEKYFSRIYGSNNKLILEAGLGEGLANITCESLFVVIPRVISSQYMINIDKTLILDMLSRLSKGYYEDGLIWALVRGGFVSRSDLPSFIADNQAYYWPRGDLLRRYLYTWYIEGVSEALSLYKELIQQLIDQLSGSGGLKIPYITAARMRDIYGSPQQLFAFEALARAYDIFGLEELREKALRSLECYVRQPPECLGFYETKKGGWWFRWGSYHYLSRDPLKREDLYVLNTHLMGVMGLLEGYRYLGCESCLKHAMKGVEALEELLDEFMRSDGYMFYSLYNKERFGELEDTIMPHLIGYHLLSTRLLLRSSYLLEGERIRKRFMDYGYRGCEYGYRKYLDGKRDLWRELVRCFIELYRLTNEKDYIYKIDRIIRKNIESIKIYGLFIDEIRDRFLPPIIRSKKEFTVALLDNSHGESRYYINSKDLVSLEISSKMHSNKTLSEIIDLKIMYSIDNDEKSFVEIYDRGNNYNLILKGSIVLAIYY